MRRSSFTVVPSVIALGTITAAAQADVLIDNVAEPIRGITILGTAKPDILWAAQSFSTPSPVRLDTIDVLVGLATDKPDVVAELRSGSDPSGPALATFIVPALDPAGPTAATLTPDAAVVLKPGEAYWLVLGCATTGSFGWAYAEGNGYVGKGSFLEYAYSEDSGVSWWIAGTDNPHQLRVNVTTGCLCPADFDCDGFITGVDFDLYVQAFENGDASADFDGDTFITGVDFDLYVQAFEAGC